MTNPKPKSGSTWRSRAARLATHPAILWLAIAGLASEVLSRDVDAGTWLGKFFEPITLMTVVLAVSTAALWFATHNLWRTAVADQRPWIPGGVQFGGYFQLTDARIVIPLHILMQNTGRSPAINARSAFTVVTSRNRKTHADYRPDFDRVRAAYLDQRGTRGFTIFPGEVRLDEFLIDVPKPAATADFTYVLNDTRYISLDVIGVILYENVHGEEFFTEFSYALYRINDGKEDHLPYDNYVCSPDGVTMRPSARAGARIR